MFGDNSSLSPLDNTMTPIAINIYCPKPQTWNSIHHKQVSRPPRHGVGRGPAAAPGVAQRWPYNGRGVRGGSGAQRRQSAAAMAQQGTWSVGRYRCRNRDSNEKQMQVKILFRVILNIMTDDNGKHWSLKRDKATHLSKWLGWNYNSSITS